MGMGSTFAAGSASDTDKDPDTVPLSQIISDANESKSRSGQ